MIGIVQKRQFSTSILKLNSNATYAAIDKDLPYERQLENLIPLKQKRIISEEGFNMLKEELLGGSREIRGFKNN